jgi:hypothetical protein
MPQLPAVDEAQAEQDLAEALAARTLLGERERKLLARDEAQLDQQVADPLPRQSRLPTRPPAAYRSADGAIASLQFGRDYTSFSSAFRRIAVRFRVKV